jgi:Domain of unknown function (DUF3883)
MPSSRDWSDVEIGAIVADYFDMLSKELRGENYIKTAHRQALRKLLNDRSHGSIERKHQNISAILREAKFPWIDGYKPLSNYQSRLAAAVLERLDEDGELNLIALRIVESYPHPPDLTGDLLNRMTPAPSLLDSVREALDTRQRTRVARRIDYLAREARNSQLGRAGEEFVVAFERARLRALGRDSLASQVEHVSATQGDGLGFDVLSFDERGDERFIEVKTTQFGREAPFFVTRSEVDFSNERQTAYDLYRVYRFRADPRLFTLPGSLASSCQLSAEQYIALPR